MELIAHRGSPRELRENTLPSFARALDRGADAIELDVHALADGTVVVHHDPVLGPDVADPRFAGRALRELRRDELADAGWRDGGTVPTLAEVLALVGDRATSYVEVKAPGIETLVGEVIREAGGPVAVHSFDHRIPSRVTSTRPGTPTGILLSSYLVDPVGALRAADARDFWVWQDFVDAALVERVHEGGGRVIVWTVNDARRAGELAALGVDGLCGDDLGILQAAVGRAPGERQPAIASYPRHTPAELARVS